MAKIKSYEDVVMIDADLASLFLRPEEAANWIYAMENGIKDWISKNNKQYWEIVRYVSMQRGILGKLEKDGKTVRLTRKDFAQVLLKFCPDAIKEGETDNTLKSNMEHYQFLKELKNIDAQLSGHLVRHHIKDVENLLDQKPLIELHEEEVKPTLEDLVEDYLRQEVEEKNTNGFPITKVCIRPQYDDVCPAISVETYCSEKLLKDHKPSLIVAYEFVDGILQKSKLNEFVGQYYGKNVKLFIVSSSGLLPDVRALATERNIGYVRLNPNSKMTSEDYILPRSIEDYTKFQHDLKVLTGEKSMTTPILIMDGSKLTSSLADVLNENGVAVKIHRLLNIPFLSNDEIEKRANELTEEDVKERIRMFKRLSTLKIDPSIDLLDNADLSIDPFEYAESCGLNYHTEEIDELQLGCLDVEKDHVILNSKGLDNYNRYRFTMAHELGHYILHSPLFKEQGVVSVGESEKTLSISISDSRRLEHQANLFASFLLMPKVLVATLYIHFFEIRIHQVYGDSFSALWYNPSQPETWAPYKNVVVSIAHILGVSQQALTIRLKSLGLLKMPD